LYAEAISEWEEVLRLNPVHETAKINIERARQRLEVAAEQGSS
jgi:cytochrome c-type biogenesis protein CcmH/NrfG